MMSSFIGDYASTSIVDWGTTSPDDNFVHVLNPFVDCWKVQSGAFSNTQYRNFDIRESYFLASPNRSYLQWFVVQTDSAIPTSGYPSLNFSYKNETDELKDALYPWKQANVSHNSHYFYPYTVAPSTTHMLILSKVSNPYHFQNARDKYDNEMHYITVTDDSNTLSLINPNGEVVGGTIAYSSYDESNLLTSTKIGHYRFNTGMTVSSSVLFGTGGATYGSGVVFVSGSTNTWVLRHSYDQLSNVGYPRAVLMIVAHTFTTSEIRTFQLSSLVNCYSTISDNGYNGFLTGPSITTDAFDSGVWLSSPDYYHTFITILHFIDPTSTFGFTVSSVLGSTFVGTCETHFLLIF